jgi:hypothetical protein
VAIFDRLRYSSSSQEDKMRAFLLSSLVGMLCVGFFSSAVQAQACTEDEQAIQKVLADFGQSCLLTTRTTLS